MRINVSMLARNARLLLVPIALAPLLLCAGSLEFRSDGFFASPDARVKFHREAWRYAPHLDVDGQLAVTIAGPILGPGYHELAAEKTQSEFDPARRRWIESGTLPGNAVACCRTVSEYAGGLLVRLEYGQTPPRITEAMCRILLPIAVFKNRRVRWDGGAVVLPEAKPDDDHRVLLHDAAGNANRFRIELGHGLELGLQFLSPTRDRSLSDCRKWNDEMNYDLRAEFAGKTLSMFLCVLKPDDPFPAVALPAEPPPPPQVRSSDQGACFATADGLYELAIDPSGRVAVRKGGEPFFGIEAPYVREKDALQALTEPVSFHAVTNRVEVVSTARGKPLRVRQTFAMEEDGWLSVTVQFEGVPAGSQEAGVELALPAAAFAGKTVRAGERLIDLPATPAADATLLDDWAGKIPEYALPPDGRQRVTLICDQSAHTFLRDYRTWAQNSFKLGLLAKDGMVKYRLHLWTDDSPLPAHGRGNLLHEGASFEVGPESVRPFACFSWTEKMVEPGIAPAFDTTTAVHGATSLRLTAGDAVRQGNPHGFSFVGATFNRVALQRDRLHTVSAWIQADRPGMKAVLFCGESTWDASDWGAFPVSTQWHRYVFPFYTGDFRKSGYWFAWAGIDSACTQGTLWVDAVQLEEGPLSDFQPGSEVEYGVEATSPQKLFESGTPCQAVLRVRNNGQHPLSTTVAYVIRDYNERQVRTGDIPVHAAAASTAAYPVELGALPCGYYRGSFATREGPTNELIFGVYAPQPLTPLPDDWPLACHNDPSPLVRKLGFGSVRAFEIFEFASIAPQAGAFDFARADRMVADAERCGLTIMPILGQFEWPSYRKEPPIPAWAQARVSEGSAANGNRRMVWPKIETWKAYVKALTRHYKGRIGYWEVMNEPNLLMTSQDYAPYLQAAYEAAKAGDPDCKVVGVCATSDFAGKPDSFTDAVLKLGGSRWFDILSVHLYDSHPPERTLDAGSDQLLEHWRRTLKDTYGKDATVWHTERSFIARESAYSDRKVNVPVEYCDEPQFLIDTFKHKAEYMIRETLLDAVAGKGGRFFWFGQFDAEPTFITVRSFQPYGLDHTEYDQAPCPELIAANGLARALTGMSHPYRQLSWGDGNRACVFTGEQGAVAALWNWKGRDRAVIHVGKIPAALRDFFGEPMAIAPDAKGELSVDLEGAPKYLTFPGKDGPICCQLIHPAPSP